MPPKMTSPTPEEAMTMLKTCPLSEDDLMVIIRDGRAAEQTSRQIAIEVLAALRTPEPIKGDALPFTVADQTPIVAQVKVERREKGYRPEVKGDAVAMCEQIKVAFWASLTNANAGMKWLDYDSMEEMISAAWEGFEEPAAAYITAQAGHR